ncbi:MAG TPA: hypothetical protein VMD98_03460, partial [Bryocella sp.]|nr:hypothetical protein [Bryocella sp.]
MALSRRDLLKMGVVGGASTALTGTAMAAEEPTAPRDAVGMLYDATLCVGCKSCVVACANANGLTPDTRLDPLHQAPVDLNAFTKNIIKLYTPAAGESGSYSFVKRQCMHCV